MKHNPRRLVIALMILFIFQLAACAQTPAAGPDIGQPAFIEEIEGTEFNRVTLSERAAQRLDVQTAQVREDQIGTARRLVIPYAAVIYGLHGETWAYVSPSPLTFVREPITIDFIEGDQAVLTQGPPAGTEVAIVGVAELYGIDTGVGK